MVNFARGRECFVGLYLQYIISLHIIRDGAVNRALGDGASLEALDSTLSHLKKESDLDHRYLKVETRLTKIIKNKNLQ